MCYRMFNALFATEFAITIKTSLKKIITFLIVVVCALYANIVFAYDICIKGPSGYLHSTNDKYQFPQDYDFKAVCEHACHHLSVTIQPRAIAVSVEKGTALGRGHVLLGKEFPQLHRIHFGAWSSTYSLVKHVVDSQCGGPRSGYGAVCICTLDIL